jgi:hypothetical protein
VRAKGTCCEVERKVGTAVNGILRMVRMADFRVLRSLDRRPGSGLFEVKTKDRRAWRPRVGDSEAGRGLCSWEMRRACATPGRDRRSFLLKLYRGDQVEAAGGEVRSRARTAFIEVLGKGREGRLGGLRPLGTRPGAGLFEVETRGRGIVLVGKSRNKAGPAFLKVRA